MSDLVAEQLETRIAGVAADVRAALDGWVAAQRRLSIELTMKLGSLSGELAGAQRRFVAEVGAGPVTTRDEAWRALEWVRRLDRERVRIEEEVWALVARARQDEGEFRARLLTQAREVGAGPAAVVEAMQSAIEGVAEGGTRLGDTELGKSLAAARARVLADARADAERLFAGAEARLASVLERGTLDWEQVSERFEAAASERLGGEAGEAGERAPRAPRVARVKAPPPVKRKKARVPKFLLGGFYKKGNMRRVGDDVEITFVNPLAFCIVINGDPVNIDGRLHPTEETTLDNGDKRILGTQLGPDNYLKYAKGAALKLTLAGCKLGPGPHRVKLSLELRKMGWVDLDITDEAQ